MALQGNQVPHSVVHKTTEARNGFCYVLPTAVTKITWVTLKAACQTAKEALKKQSNIGFMYN